MRPNRRPGLSLAEVLVALFVMALGLMALLTLFPLGAMQIGQALKDDRTAQTAHQADAWVRAYWRAMYPGGQTTPSDPLANALDEPNLLNRTAATTTTGGVTTAVPGVYQNNYSIGTRSLPLNLGPPLLRARPTMPADIGQRIDQLDVSGDVLADPTGLDALPADTATDAFRFSRVPAGGVVGSAAGYPVVIDPLGFLARGSAVRNWVGRDSVSNAGVNGVYGTDPALTPTLLPRRNTAATPNATAAYSTCALTDDLTFQSNGSAGQGEPLNRQGRYHWAAVVQRLVNSNTTEATLTILVFDGRPAFLAFPGDEVVLTNTFISGVVANARSMTLAVPTRGADQPQLVRRGGWVAVAGMDAPGVAGGVRGVSFHRVTGLTTGDETALPQYPSGPNVAVTQLALDLDPPLPAQVSANPQVYLLANLSEVFVMPDKLTVR